jgi:hypothetical protein
MRALGEDPETYKARSDVKLIKKIMEDVLSTPAERRVHKLSIKNLSELTVIKDVASLISSELGNSNIEISVFGEEEENAKKNDPQSKARSSRPFKPAIYLS